MLFESDDDRSICWDITELENKVIGGKIGTLWGSGDGRLTCCWETTESENKFGGIHGTLLISGDDR